MNNPLVSVIMPAYNTEQYIAEAIESILNQSFTDFEFIIVDDASNDNTWDIIQQYAKQDKRIVTLRNDKNRYISYTRNRGIAISKGKYIACMDSDDYSYPDRLEKQVSLMETNPDLAVSGSVVEICDEFMNTLNLRRYLLTDKEIRRKLFRYSPFCHAVTIYRTDILKQVNGYNEYLYEAEDYELYFKIGKLGKFGNLDSVIYKIRVRSSSVSHISIKRAERLTIYVRLKAMAEYGYYSTWFDKMYLAAQWLSMYIIPSRFKFRIFNWLRKS